MSLTQDSSYASISHRTVTAFFDTRDAAERAIQELTAAGVSRDQIHLLEGGSQTTTTGATGTQDKGFWDSLKDLFLPEEDRYAYAEGLRRGGYLLSVRTDSADYDRVVDILDGGGSVDIDEREAAWKTEGWTGYQPGAAATSALATGATMAGTSSTASGGATGTTRALGAEQEEVIPVYEENIRIGKREVNQGRVRIRSYVVETPVSEQVTLHSESVQVERRPVDRPVAGTDALFQDRVIEAEQYSEEAVIAKEARVKEEISLRKVGEDRSQTVTDSVRRTEVEVDDGRGLGVVGATSGVSANTIREHMDVIASDGQKVGTVDHMEGSDRIKLAKTTSPDGQHHYVSLAWVDHVDTHVHLNKTSTDVRASW